MPPGELMYMAISFLGLSASRNRSCMQIEAATSSLMGLERKMMRSFRRREGSVYCSQPRLVCSTMTGQNVLTVGGTELDMLAPGSLTDAVQEVRLGPGITPSRELSLVAAVLLAGALAMIVVVVVPVVVVGVIVLLRAVRVGRSA